MTAKLNIVMMGATGAVGSHAAKVLAGYSGLGRLTLLGRRPLDVLSGSHIQQHRIDIFEPSTYQTLLPGHQTAVCTLGVGEPSKMSKQQFLKIDKLAVLDFASGCKDAGVRHFQLLGSIGASAASRSFYLKAKGELEDGLRALKFERLSLFQPSMILTPSNRYGFTQAVVLRVWPLLKPFLVGRWRKYRGIPVAKLGAAIAQNTRVPGSGEEVLQWDQITALAGAISAGQALSAVTAKH